jgi:hypothetical protein
MSTAIDTSRRTKIKNLLSQKPSLESFLKKERFSLSAYSFTAIFSWLDFFGFEMKQINESLCVLARNNLGAFLLLPPIGGGLRQETIDECFDWMGRLNGGSGISRIENARFEDLKHFSSEKFRVTSKGYEYCYFREHIADLKGNAFKSKRSDYNQFVRNNSVEFVPFTLDMKEECVVLYEKWAEMKSRSTEDDIYREMILENRTVHDLLMENVSGLGLTGRVVRVGGRIKGYTFGFPLNGKIFCVLLEITDPDVAGLPTFVFREFCRDKDVVPYDFINAMDDFGMANITRAKLSFRPTVLIPSYSITREEF